LSGRAAAIAKRVVGITPDGDPANRAPPPGGRSAGAPLADCADCPGNLRNRLRNLRRALVEWDIDQGM
jgi:hypothetical protein